MANCKFLASLLTLVLSAPIQVVIAQDVEPLSQVSQAEDNNLQTEIGCQGDPYCLNRLGLKLYGEDKLEEGIQIYLKAINIHKNRTNLHRESIAIIYNNLGNAYRKKNKLTEAIKAYSEAIKYDSKYANAYNNLGYTFYLQKKPTLAEKNLRQAIELKPDNSTYRTHLATVLRQQGKLQEAQKVLSNVNSSNNPHFYNERGEQLYRENKFDGAIANFQEAIRISPQATFYNNLGNAYSAKDNLDQAIEEYKKGIQKDPNFPSAYNGLGYALKLKQKYDDSNTELLREAIKNFQQALKLKPDFVIAKNNLKQTQRLLNTITNPNSLVQDNRECLNLRSKEPLFDIYRSIVEIDADFRGGKNARGTGWVIKREGNKAWIVTNLHVVTDTEMKIEDNNSGSQNIQVTFFCKVTGKIPPQFKAQIVTSIESDKSLDLAILEVNDIPDDIQRLGLPKSSDIVAPNTPVSIIGHPSESTWKLVTGTVKSYLPGENKIQIEAILNKGNSGSPVLDRENRVVGVIVEKPTDNYDDSSKSTSNQEYGFAYSIEIIIQELKKMGINL